MKRITKDVKERSNRFFEEMLKSLDLEITEDSNGLFCIVHKNRKKHKLSVKTKLAVCLYLG